MTGTAQYEAFVLRRGSPNDENRRATAEADRDYSVAWVHLGPCAPIDEAVRIWRDRMAPSNEGGPETTATSGRGNNQHPVSEQRESRTKERQSPAPAQVENGRQQQPQALLRQLVWEKVEPHLADCSAVVVIPDAALTAVPWGALPGRRPDSFLIEEYAIATASNGKLLYGVLTQEVPQGDRLFAIGTAKYDDVSVAQDAPLVAAAHRGPARDADNRTKWPYLAASGPESESIARLWQSAGGKAQVLQGSSANEQAVRESMPASRYIHLPTHGFFADPKFRSVLQHDVERERLLLGGFEMTGLRGSVTGRNPLILSGIVLAGANVPQPTNDWGAPVGDDGIMTAEEVVDLDLSDTELVVLSACDTGLGNVAGGEGVYGLERAFHLAGARTVVASLWKVDDEITRLLMTEFYKNLWQNNLPKLEALRQAQLHVMRHGPGDSSHPRYWAGWVLSGDPGNLSQIGTVTTAANIVERSTQAGNRTPTNTQNQETAGGLSPGCSSSELSLFLS